MLVKAAPGLKVPMEGRPRGFISGPDPVRVPDTAYYQRMVKDGSLTVIDAELIDGGKAKSTKKK